MDAVSGMMELREAPLPKDIFRLGVEGINRIWRNAKLRAVITVFAEDYEMYRRRLENLIRVIKEKLEEIPYMDKLSSWRSRGITTVCGFVAEVGDIRYSVLYIIEL